jgi:dipeptidyl aminopeptidase/acylaminoacyl peptidase
LLEITMRSTVALLALAFALPINAQPLTLDQVMADPDWIGNPVEAVWWQLDGNTLTYQQKQNGSTLRNRIVLDLASGTSRVAAPAQEATLDPASVVFDRARQRALFVRNGDVFVRTLATGALRQLSASAESEADPMFSADQQAALWRVGNDWFALNFSEGVARAVALPRTEKDPQADPDADDLRSNQLRLISTLAGDREQRKATQQREQDLRKADPSRAAAPVYLGDDIEIQASSLSPDSRWLLIVTTAKNGDKGKAGKMPKYVTETGYEEFEDVRTRVGRKTPLAHSLKLIDLSDGSISTLDLKALPGIDKDPLARLRKAAGRDPLKGLRAVTSDTPLWNRSGDRAAIVLRAIDNKDRWIVSLDPADKSLSTRHRLTDPGWINWSFNDLGWMPDDRSLWLLSEQNGYSHLYLAPAGKAAKALTAGNWEVSQPALSADGQRFYFVCNRQSPGDYELCALDMKSAAVRELTALDGVENFALSPDQQHLVLRHSGSYLPPQLSVMAADGSALRQLTDTRSEAFKAQQWIAPQLVQVPSKHGAGSIAAKLYRPDALQPGKRYPVVMFVHGAGYLQNVWSRYPNYFREQMFHNLLVQRGYIVLDMDYRGSAGYGRDWRTAIYRQMGHPELDDYLDGIDWLVDNQQADRSKIGIYGGSYGGFMAFMALLRAPDAFLAGAALRPVTDWTMYNHEYTANILNTPDIDPEAYRISSPIEYAQNLKGHLLIAHGMIDDNVFYQDSVRFTQRLIELKKANWELASYPLERHGFVHAESWYDQYRRILELFERTLKTTP